jgi:hypothetical protein
MHKFLYLLMLAVLAYGIYNAMQKHTTPSQRPKHTCDACRISNDQKHNLEAELSRIDTPEYILHYIVDVIDYGSDTLGFRGGVMEGGYVGHEDAEKIACYVLELSGRKCPHAYPEDAAMFYTSVCGGCHGNDGKGLGGNYPDLTRKKLLGIKRREVFLRERLQKLQREKQCAGGE